MATLTHIVMHPAGVEKMLQDADLTAYGEKVEGAARGSAPVLTGAYRDSIHMEDAPDGKGVVVVADVRMPDGHPYAIYVEADTGNLTRALDAAGGV